MKSNEEPKRALAARAFTVIEDVVLTVLIVAIVISLVLLRKRGVAAVAERAT